MLHRPVEPALNIGSYSEPILQLPEPLGKNATPGPARQFPDAPSTPQMQASSTSTRPQAGLAELERDHILEVLVTTGWWIGGSEGAAQILGLNESTLRSRVKKLGIQRPAAAKARAQGGSTDSEPESSA